MRKSVSDGFLSTFSSRSGPAEELCRFKNPDGEAFLSYATKMVPSRKNEDRLLVVEKPIYGDFIIADGLVMICDGHGGSEAADFCMRNIVRLLTEEFNRLNAAYVAKTGGEWKAWGGEVWTPWMDQSITSTFRKLHAGLIEDQETSGCTLTLLLFRKKSQCGTLHVKSAWVGDSRAVCVVQKELVPLTEDHRVSNPKEKLRVAAWYRDKTNSAPSSNPEPKAVDLQTAIPIRVNHQDPSRSLWAKPIPMPSPSSESSDPMPIPGKSRRVGSEDGPRRPYGKLNPFPHDSAASIGVIGGDALSPISAASTSASIASEPGALYSRFEENGTPPSAYAPQRPPRSPGMGARSRLSLDNVPSLEHTGSGQSPVPVVSPITVGMERISGGQMGAELNFSRHSFQRDLPPSAESSSMPYSVPNADGKRLSLGTPPIIGGVRPSSMPDDSTTLAEHSAWSEDESEDQFDDEDTRLRLRQWEDKPHSLSRQSFCGVFVDVYGNRIGQTERVFSGNGTSLGVTRSIGDIHGARSVTCDPEILEFSFARSARIVVASDGLWDGLHDPRGQRLVDFSLDRILDPRKAVAKMSKHRDADLRRLSLAPDDLAIAVIDFLGSSAPEAPPWSSPGVMSKAASHKGGLMDTAMSLDSLQLPAGRPRANTTGSYDSATAIGRPTATPNAWASPAKLPPEIAAGGDASSRSGAGCVVA